MQLIDTLKGYAYELSLESAKDSCRVTVVTECDTLHEFSRTIDLACKNMLPRVASMLERRNLILKTVDKFTRSIGGNVEILFSDFLSLTEEIDMRDHTTFLCVEGVCSLEQGENCLHSLRRGVPRNRDTEINSSHFIRALVRGLQLASIG
jgi:hypothetical protein